MVVTQIAFDGPEVQQRFRRCIFGSVIAQLDRLEPHLSALGFPDRLSIMVAVINKTVAIMTGEKPVQNFIN